MLLDEHISADGPLPALPELSQLGGEPMDKVLKSAGHVHAAFADVLDRPAKGGAISCRF